MNLDQIRALAGIPMRRSTGQQITEAKTFAPVKADGHFDITVPESAVGKIAIALAKEGLPVDVTYDGMENFFFNFKSSELKDKAASLAQAYVKEEEEVAEAAKYVAREDHDTKDGTWYVDNPDGSLHSKGLAEADAKELADKLNKSGDWTQGLDLNKVGPRPDAVA